MWLKAIQIIPRISREEWNNLDLISRWLIATRAAVIVMIFISAAIAGLWAFRNGQFNLVY
jgi:1,4-dihydroxy-2-naphthoate octaprenyltransferase